ncbi:MAG: hypothetical protein ABSF81_10500 [Bacteroidales bacterium]
MKTLSLFPSQANAFGILTDKEINEAISLNLLISSSTFEQNCLEASSYDIRIGAKGVVGGEGIELDLKKEALELSPGAYAGIISLEKLILPTNIFARIGSKRALSYDGIILLTGGIIDPGYEGHLLFGLYNASQRKVILRNGRKICNIVFERLSSLPEKKAPCDSNLKVGSFPDTFIDRMVNMDVLPWMQISERVKQIELITKDIIDLKARYEDVLQPIKDLTGNVKSLTKDVETLSFSTKELSKDLDKVNLLVKENSQQIAQLTSNLTIVSGQNQNLISNIANFSEEQKGQKEKIISLTTDLSKYKIISYIFWAVVLLVAGALLPKLFDIIFK